MHFICIFQRLETNWQHPLRLQIMWLSLPAIHPQCPCAGAVLLSPPERLLAIQSVVHLWAPTTPPLSATYKCKLRTKTKLSVLPLAIQRHFGLVTYVTLYDMFTKICRWPLNFLLLDVCLWILVWLNGHNIRILFVHSTAQSVVVQNLDPSTRYEFVVRLHVDQMSSPWSSVVYHRTLPAGNKLDITVTLFFQDYVAFWLCCHDHADSNQLISYFSGSVVCHECVFSVYSTQPTTCRSASDSDRGRHCPRVLEGAHGAQCGGYTLYHPVRFPESLVSWTLANNAEGGWVVHWIMLSVKALMQNVFRGFGSTTSYKQVIILQF